MRQVRRASVSFVLTKRKMTSWSDQQDQRDGLTHVPDQRVGIFRVGDAEGGLARASRAVDHEHGVQQANRTL